MVSPIDEVTFDKEEPIENLTTWVCENGSFVPTAKLTDNESFSIISDYIGRPVLAFDEKGEKVWSTDYDIYGGLRNLKGNKDFIPFRQLGQYYDEETNLCYNRFRYYSPESGLYISKDPINILGGLNLYSYVFDTNSWVDVFGLAPTDPIDRAIIKELLGDIKNKGGAYMFKTIDLRDGIEKWYVGKAKNLYKRLRQHLGTGKLDPSRLDTINVLAIVDGKNIDFFKAEADIMAEFKKVGEKLANKIESPKCKS